MSSATVLDSTVTSGRRNPAVSGPLIIAGLALLAHLPLVFTHFQQLWLKPHYQLFPLVLAGGFALVWPMASITLKPPGPLRIASNVFMAGTAIVAIGMLGDSLGILVGSPSTWVALGGIFLLVSIPLSIVTGIGAIRGDPPNPRNGIRLAWVCLLLLVFIVFFNTPVVGVFSVFLLIAATTITQGGRGLFWRCLPAMAYLLLIIPPPFGLDATLVFKLQVFASKLSSKILDLMGVYHNLAGVTIEIGRKQFEVENACSGISSLLSTLACVLFYVLWCKVHWLRGILLTLISLGWVLLNNTFRIVLIAYFWTNWGIELSEGLPHQILGLLLFAVTLFFIWSTDRLLMFFGRSDANQRRFEAVNINAPALQAGVGALSRVSGAWYRSVLLGSLFGLLVAVQAAEWYAYRTRVPYSGSALSKLYNQMEVSTLPETVGRWKRAEKIDNSQRPPGHAFGEFSRLWRYSNDVIKNKCDISLDYPFPEYHDLRICYENTGWTIDSFEAFTPPNIEPPLHCVRVKMKSRVEVYACLWFCEFDQDGIGLEPIFEKTQYNTFADRIAFKFYSESHRWKSLFFPTKTVASTGLGSILQVQLLYSGVTRPSEEINEELESMFVAAAQKLRDKCVELSKNR